MESIRELLDYVYVTIEHGLTLATNAFRQFKDNITGWFQYFTGGRFALSDGDDRENSDDENTHQSFDDDLDDLDDDDLVHFTPGPNFKLELEYDSDEKTHQSAVADDDLDDDDLYKSMAELEVDSDENTYKSSDDDEDNTGENACNYCCF